MDMLDRVRQVWTEVLDVREVGVDVNFFEAGGDSILLIILLEKLNALTGRGLEPPDLFRHTTVRAQADLLAGRVGAPTPAPDGNDRSALLDRARRGN
ncbi:phosphopantetheine-binding protein [Amycolatopsis taiwanensis]|uniref:phosphopantetheine-binding protein n=1 Tax=Amycolatopsis taiwanensis TaxID=342230 RepID=UPI0004B3D0FF|nr:phosphopantetheine-binding protein [Amycolatopsis taiwanensis]